MLPQSFQFLPLSRRSVEAQSSGGHISGHSGLLLLRGVDRRLSLSSRLSNLLNDQRQTGRVQPDVQAMLQQRLFGLAAGFEDLNDHSHLRDDFGSTQANEECARQSSANNEAKFQAECHNFELTPIGQR